MGLVSYWDRGRGQTGKQSLSVLFRSSLQPPLIVRHRKCCSLNTFLPCQPHHTHEQTPAFSRLLARSFHAADIIGLDMHLVQVDVNADVKGR